MDKRIRIILGLFFIGIIILMTIVIFINKDTWFTNKVTLEYPDGCIEIYKNGEIVTDECIVGRMIVEESKNKYNDSIHPSFTLPPISSK